MATAFARSTGANARQPQWDDQEEPQSRGRGNWLPLDALDDDQAYVGTPTLHANPAPRRDTQAAPQRQWFRPTSPQSRTSHSPVQAQQNGQETRPETNIKGAQVKAIAIAAGVLVFALTAYVALSAALDWTRVKLDDLQYGRPRTMQLDAYVGHNEAEGMPSHFIAMNLNRRVTILQLPGGDPAKAATIVGPYLFGQGEDLTPIELDVRDANTDGKPDLLVSVKNEQLLYLNDGTAFRLTTPEERAAIGRASQPAPQAMEASK